MNQENPNEETVKVRYRKYSAWTVIKIMVFAWLLTFIMNVGSYSLVSFNHIMSKAIGLASDFVGFCANCLQAIG